MKIEAQTKAWKQQERDDEQQQILPVNLSLQLVPLRSLNRDKVYTDGMIFMLINVFLNKHGLYKCPALTQTKFNF